MASNISAVQAVLLKRVHEQGISHTHTRNAGANRAFWRSQPIDAAEFVQCSGIGWQLNPTAAANWLTAATKLGEA